MFLGVNIFNRKENVGPIIPTKVLNTDECGIVAVGTTLGKLSYRARGRGFASTTGIQKVLILQSQKHKRNRRARNIEADFDIYLTDGRVIEVHSFDRATIEAAIKYAPVKDIRAGYRDMRGRGK